MRPFIIGVSGGSGSGKTTLANRLQAELGPEKAAILYQDSYYIDQSHRFDKDGGAVNFDHPDALEFSALFQHLKQLKNEETIQVPVYDFATHKRLSRTTTFPPKPVIIVEGILIYSSPEFLQHFDLSVFVDAPEEIRYARRLRRDTEERGRTEEGVYQQFYNQVAPMHNLFVEPSKVNANILCDGTTPFECDIEDILARVNFA